MIEFEYEKQLSTIPTNENTLLASTEFYTGEYDISDVFWEYVAHEIDEFGINSNLIDEGVELFIELLKENIPFCVSVELEDEEYSGKIIELVYFKVSIPDPKQAIYFKLKYL